MIIYASRKMKRLLHTRPDGSPDTITFSDMIFGDVIDHAWEINKYIFDWDDIPPRCFFRFMIKTWRVVRIRSTCMFSELFKKINIFHFHFYRRTIYWWEIVCSTTLLVWFQYELIYDAIIFIVKEMHNALFATLRVM